jgi:hypothetical protein
LFFGNLHTMTKPAVSLLVKVPALLYEPIGEYRHTARHETRQQALVALISAGLAAAMTKPVTLPSANAQSNEAAQRLCGGSEANGRAQRQW